MFKRINIFWKLIVTFMVIIVITMMTMDIATNLVPPGISAVLAGVIIAVAFAFGSAWFFTTYFVKKPVEKLANGMNRLAEKEFEFRLDERGTDEFSSLASSFNDMADMLTSSLTELDKTRDYLHGILESSADIIITVTPSGNIRTFNTGSENALGYRRRDVIGKPVTKLFLNPQDREVAIAKLRFTDNVVNFKTKFLTKSGETRNVLLTLSRLRNSTGEIIGTIGISKDITEELRLQKQWMQSERFVAIGQVFTGIQHSMKNMLNACTGGAYMVRTGLKKDDRKMLEEGWQIVQEGITRMTDMSMNMLKYVKEWKPRFDQVDLNKTLSGIDQVIGRSAKERGIRFSLKDVPELPHISCDAQMIHSAVMDIVSNALDACFWKEYGEVEIPEVTMSAYTDNDRQEAIIEIRDNGCGMTEDIIAHIFTPFFSTKSKAGTGLGLSITSRMIDVHGGKIDVESEPDKGTVFRIVLPIDENSRSKEIIDGKKGFGSRR